MIYKGSPSLIIFKSFHMLLLHSCSFGRTHLNEDTAGTKPSLLLLVVHHLTIASCASSKHQLRQKTIGVLFEGGTPYLLSNLSSIQFLSHHMGLMVAHLRLLEDLGRRFKVRERGAAAPGVEVQGVGVWSMLADGGGAKLGWGARGSDDSFKQLYKCDFLRSRMWSSYWRQLTNHL